MGQQQLLLIVLGVIIVGISIIAGITIFRENAISSKRDTLFNEANHIAALAVKFYQTPVVMGGGGNSFIGFIIPNSMVETPSGSFSAEVFNDRVVLTATGNEVVTGSDSVKVQLTITPNNITSEIIN